MTDQEPSWDAPSDEEIQRFRRVANKPRKNGRRWWTTRFWLRLIAGLKGHPEDDK